MRSGGLKLDRVHLVMKFVCDAPDGKAWFRIESEAEAVRESEMMQHAVEKYFRQEWAKAAERYQPSSNVFFEQEIGLKAHIQRTMPLFLTLRDGEGNGLATAMLPSGGDGGGFRTIIVGKANADPYPGEGEAIRALAEHFGVTLERSRCYPYRRS